MPPPPMTLKDEQGKMRPFVVKGKRKCIESGCKLLIRKSNLVYLKLAYEF